MLIIRAGQNSIFYDKFLRESRVYIPWNGFKQDLSQFTSMPDFKILVEKEKGRVHRSAIANWASQLYSFVVEAKTDDLVLIPSKGSHTYCLAKLAGNYTYNVNEPDGLYHCRDIKILMKNIPKTIFSQKIKYSLGAYRTIFRTKHEEEIIRRIKEWKGRKE